MFSRFLKYLIKPLLVSKSLYVMVFMIPVIIIVQNIGANIQQVASLIPLSLTIMGVFTGLMTVSLIRIPPAFTDYLIVLIGSKRLVKYLWTASMLLSLIIVAIIDMVLLMFYNIVGLHINIYTLLLGLITALIVSGLTSTLLLIGSTLGFSIVLIVSLIQPLLLRITTTILKLETNTLATAVLLAYLIPSTILLLTLTFTSEERLRKHIARISRITTSFI